MIIISSCNKDNDDISPELCGVWQNNAYIYCFNSDGSGYWQYSPYNGAFEVHGDKKSYFSWTASETIVSIMYDGTGIVSAGTTDSFYYEVNGNMLVMIDLESGDTNTYNRKTGNSNSTNYGEDDKKESDTEPNIDYGKYVTVECSYSDYYWHVKFTSTLEKEFPNEKFKYNVYFGISSETDYYSVTSSQTNIGEKYYQYVSDGVTYTEFTKPFFFHFVAMSSYNPSMSWKYDEILSKCSMYIASYNTLKNQSSMTSDEKILYQDLKKYLNQSEQQARSEQSRILSSVLKDNKTIVQKYYRL